MIAVAIAPLGAIGLSGVEVTARGAMEGVYPAALVGVSMPLAATVTVTEGLAFAPGGTDEVPQEILPRTMAVEVAQFIRGRSLGMVAINIIGVSRTSLFIAAQAPFAAFFAIAFTGEDLRPVVVVGAIGVVVAPLLAGGDSPTQGWRTDRRYLAGDLIRLVSGASMAADTVLAKQSIGIYNSPFGYNLAQYADWPDDPRASFGRGRCPQIRPSGSLTRNSWASSPCAA